MCQYTETISIIMHIFAIIPLEPFMHHMIIIMGWPLLSKRNPIMYITTISRI